MEAPASRREGQGGDKASVLAAISDRTIRGALAMILRQAILIPIRLVANILLARQLAPADFGAYAIAIFFISTATLFTDVGLMAALIQRRDPPASSELRTVFTIRFLLALGWILLFLGATPVLAEVFRLSDASRHVIPWLGLVLPLGAFSSISTMRLERSLSYPRVAQIDVLVVVVFQVTAIALAYSGAGVWSFVGAALASEGVRAVALFASSPWPAGFAVDRSLLRASIRFGAPFQAGVWTSLLRDHIAALLAGPLFGPRAVGFLNWAHSVAYQASQAFTEVLGRVSFPSLSRVQEDREAFGHMLEKLLRALMLLTTPMLAIMAGLIPWIVAVLYTEKWAPAIPAFYGFAVRMLGGAITTPLVAALNALGYPRRSLRILLLWTASDWGAALLLTARYGFTGVAMAYGVSVWVPVVWLILELTTRVPVRWGYALVRPTLAGLVILLVLRKLGGRCVSDLSSLLLVAGLGGLLYPVALLLLEGKAWVSEIRASLRLIARVMRSSPETSYVGHERV